MFTPSNAIVGGWSVFRLAIEFFIPFDYFFFLGWSDKQVVGSSDGKRSLPPMDLCSITEVTNALLVLEEGGGFRNSF